MDITVNKLILKKPQEEATSNLQVLVNGTTILKFEVPPMQKSVVIDKKIVDVADNDKVQVLLDDTLIGECTIEANKAL